MSLPTAILKEIRDHFLGHVPRKIAIQQARQADAEKLDPTPVEITVEHAPTMRETIQAYVRDQVAYQLAQEGHEVGTFEEEDDFSYEEDDSPWESRYELSDMQEVVPAGDFEITLDGSKDEPVDQAETPPAAAVAKPDESPPGES